MSTIFVIDYGLSKRYIANEQHIQESNSKKLTGTAKYASINAH